MPPSGQYGSCLHHRGDKRLSEGLVTEPAIKAPDERVLGWLIWRSPMHSTWRSCNQRRIEVDVSSVPLALTNASGLPRIAAVASIACAPPGTRQRRIGHERQAFALDVVHHPQDAETPATAKCVRDEVQRRWFSHYGRVIGALVPSASFLPPQRPILRPSLRQSLRRFSSFGFSPSRAGR